jgi:hypothetical protein
MAELMQVVGAEIEWDLHVALPNLKGACEATERQGEMKTADHASARPPTNLHPDGPRWRERAAIISRVLTLYDRLRDFPRGTVRR